MINARGKHVTMVHTNKTGNKCVDVDVVKGGKRTRVFTCLVTIILPKQTKPFYLSSIIGAYKKAHPQFAHATNFKIINNYFQPQMSSGTLTGLKVELLNSAKGTIAGSSLSGTAMIITSPMKLTNLGWIRGAGGRGGYGGQGGTSGPLSKQVVAKPAKTAKAMRTGGLAAIAANIRKAERAVGFPKWIVRWNVKTNAPGILEGFCGQRGKLYKGSPSRLKTSVTLCGIKYMIDFGPWTSHRLYWIYTASTLYKSVTVAGHSGGAGGYGGQGIWWNHNPTKGHVGAIGGVNKTSGITGYRGGTGGKGADGATWGTAGVRGHQGATGAGKGGLAGAYGPATGSHGPTGAGKAITGYRFILHNGSNAGRLSGIHVN